MRNNFLTSKDVVKKPIDFDRVKTDLRYGMQTLLNFSLEDRPDQVPIVEVIQDGARKILLNKGRRWGGTYLTTAIALTLAAQRPGTKVGVYSPGWDTTEIYMDQIREHLDKSILGASIVENLKMKIKLSNGSSILGKVASKMAQGKRGRGFDVLVFTEAAFISDTEMHVIRLSKLDRKNAIEILESSPNGMNHFGKIFLNNQNYISFQLPTRLNPLIDPKDLEIERDMMTETQARQELDAEILDDSNSPFPQILIDEAVKTSKYERFWTQCESPGYYVAGLDLGRKRDKSVMVIIKIEDDGNLQIVHIKEFFYNAEDPRFWSKISDHAEYLCKHFKIQNMLVDCTGLGDKFVIDMKNDFYSHQINTRIEGFNFTYASKNKWEGLINQLALKFERYLIHFPFHLEFIKQLRSIRFHTQKALFEAIGKSPDIVMATALAVKAAPQHTKATFHSRCNDKQTNLFKTSQAISYP